MKYLVLIKTKFKESFVYRVSTFAGIIVGILQVYILYYIWSNIYDNTSSMNGYDLKQMLTYVILATVIYRLIELGITLRVADLVKSGEISLLMIKPISFVKSMICESIGSLISSMFTLVIPIFLFCEITIGIYIQKDIISLLCFAISIIFSILISIYIDLLFGIFAFWTENGWGLRVIRQAMIKLFSGALIPIALLPLSVKRLCDFLPFKSLVDVPLNIYIFGASNSTIYNLFYQLLWIIGLRILIAMLYNKIVKRLDVNGG